MTVLTKVQNARDSAATKKRILTAARSEFAQYGMAGARIERISELAQANLQLIYRYFGKKEDLYVAVLEDAYMEVRHSEEDLDLTCLPPLRAVQELTVYTFDFLVKNPFFVRLMMGENLMEAAFAKRSENIRNFSRPLQNTLKQIIDRGKAEREFLDIDPIELYVVILSLCFVHISNQHTLGVMFGKRINSKESIARRREIVLRAVTALLTSDPSKQK